MTLKYKINYTCIADILEEHTCTGVINGNDLTEIASKLNDYYIGTHSDFYSLTLELPVMEGDPPDGLVELTDE